MKRARKFAVSLTGFAAGIGMLLGGLFSSADDLLADEARRAGRPAANGPIQPMTASTDVTRIPLQAELTAADRLRQWIWHLPAVVRAAVLLPLWALGRGVMALASLLFRALSPALAVLLHFVGQALLLFLLFALLYRLLFPHARLRDLFKKGRWLWLLGGALLLTAADRTLLYVLEDWVWIRLLIGAAAALLVLALVWDRLFHGHKAPELSQKWIEIPYVA